MAQLPKTRTCPKCSFEQNPLSFSKCRRCSEPLYPTGETQYLKNCVHCTEAVSINAESCPHCGCFYQNLRKPFPGDGWKGTIAWGVIFGYFGIILINFILVILFFMFFSSIFAGLGRVR